jgi:hypothetical protein
MADGEQQPPKTPNPNPNSNLVGISPELEDGWMRRDGGKKKIV